jgi:N-acetylneuraminate lyase
MPSSLHGVLPALLTPLTADEQFAPAACEQLIERLYAAGCHGLYLCGSTGEGLLQSPSMRQQVTEVAMRNAPKGAQVIVHVGAASTSQAVSLAQHAAAQGVTAVSALPPAGAYSFFEVKRYYEAIAAASDSPVLVYFFPEINASIQTLDQIFELCSIPGVVGLKFTDFDLYKMSLITRAGYTLFNGRDEVFAAGMLMGANGGIGSFYNVVPELIVKVYEEASGGDYAAARKAQDRVNDLIRLTLRYPMLASLKQMLTWSGIDCGPCLAPRRGLTAEDAARLRADLTAAGFPPEEFLRRA